MRLAFAAIVASLVASCNPTPTITASDTPTGEAHANILLIIADDFGVDASPCYEIGDAKPEMPNLERLCDQGLVFDTVWVGPNCTPTRAALLTGQYGFRTNVLEVSEVLSDEFESVQEVLARDVPVAYANAVIGKWHISGNQPPANAPASFGVSHFAGFLSGSLRPGSYIDWDYVEDGTAGHTNEYATTWMTDKAVEWIAGQRAKPWFLWLAYNAPHAPFHLPPPSLAHNVGGLSGLEPDIVANPRPYFLAMAEALDSEIGRLLDTLDPAVRLNTTIIFMGDNGTEREIAQPPFTRDRAKGSLYDGGLHVPLVVAGMGVQRRGEREDALVNGVDVTATILRLAGYREPTFHDGISFDQALSDPAFVGRRFIYADGRRAKPYNGRPGWAARDGRYELVEYESGEKELFDLSIDPGATTNLLLTSPPAEFDALIKEMEAFRNSL